MTDEYSAMQGETAGTAIDTTVPHSARIWNYWLGGKDNYEVDRMAGDQFSAIYPGIVDIARADRAFLGRVIRYVAGEAGVRQFLDVGTGLPTAANTHQVAQDVAPESRIVYVDNDPLVLAHARALLTSSPEGSTSYVDADMHDADKVLREAAQWLDLTQPVALTFMGVLGHIVDHDEARLIVARLLDGLPSGSYLSINDSVNTSAALEEALRGVRGIGCGPVPDSYPRAVRRLLRRPGTGRAGPGQRRRLAAGPRLPPRSADPAAGSRRPQTLAGNAGSPDQSGMCSPGQPVGGGHADDHARGARGQPELGDGRGRQARRRLGQVAHAGTLTRRSAPGRDGNRGTGRRAA